MIYDPATYERVKLRLAASDCHASRVRIRTRWGSSGLSDDQNALANPQKHLPATPPSHRRTRTADTPPSSLVRSDPLFPRNQRRSMEFGISIDACPRDTTRPHGDASVDDAINVRSPSNPQLRDQRHCGPHMQSISASNTKPGERKTTGARVAKSIALWKRGDFVIEGRFRG